MKQKVVEYWMVVRQKHIMRHLLDGATKSYNATPAGLEPTREYPSRFRIYRLNHSATVSYIY